MKAEYPTRCPICGSGGVVVRRYLRLDSSSLVRNIAYAIPTAVARFLAMLSAHFAKAYSPVLTNRQYFDRGAYFCPSCVTGSISPALSNEELSRYYSEFYWTNRDAFDGHHVPREDRPNDRQLVITRDRMAWIDAHVSTYHTVIDFGAGDCAATYGFAQAGKAVHVVDPSDRARVLAEKYGAGYTVSLDGAPVVDLFFSAHSIEHVANLLQSLASILDHTREGGYVFIETPNIGDVEVFEGLVHTPHTFMLSARTFEALESRLPFEIVAVDVCGPKWSAGHPAIASSERTDLRVLLKKTVSSNGGGST